MKQAAKEAEEAVFQNDGILSGMVVGGRNLLNGRINGVQRFGNKHFGIGDLTIPYAQTPANIVEQTINYSPAGALKALKNTIQGNQRQATLDLARSIMGTGIGAAGFGLGKAGLANAELDPRERDNLRLLGVRDQSIQTPFGNVSYSQLQPVSALFAAGNSLADGNKGALNNAISSIANMPMLDSISRFNREEGYSGKLDALTQRAEKAYATQDEYGPPRLPPLSHQYPAALGPA